MDSVDELGFRLFELCLKISLVDLGFRELVDDDDDDAGFRD